MSIAEKLTTIAENMHRVYAAGQAAGGGASQEEIEQLKAFRGLNDYYEGRTTVFYNPYITTIGPRRFYSEKVEGLTEVDIPNVTKIEYQGFYNCVSVTNINMPNVKILGNGAIQACTGLTSLSLPNLEEAGANALRQLTGITALDLPNLKTADMHVFRQNTNLKEIKLPSLITTGTTCFQECSSLENIIFPSISSMGGSPFHTCTSLQRLIITNEETVCTLGSQSLFSSNEIGSALLREHFPNFEGIYVPDELVDNYKGATNWTLYADHIKPISEWDGYEKYLEELEGAK